MTLQRNDILGTWQLESFVARDMVTGVDRHPLGDHPAGLIIYTPDGYMSAQLASGPTAADYIAYGGRFDLDEQAAVVHHEVSMATMPELLAAPQFRDVRVDADRLTLSATMTGADGIPIHSTLGWRRATQSGSTGATGHS